MIKKSQKSVQKSFLKAYFPYFFAVLAIFGLVFVGSMNKSSATTNTLSMESLANNNFSGVSTSQLSEFYTVASLADSMKLASSEIISSNYVTVSVLSNAGQSSSEKLEKHVITDTSHLSRCGVTYYTVADGETMDSIAQKYGISTDQIRWSNNLKTTSLSVGQVLAIPGASGIVYTVKSGDNVASIAQKYGSSTDEIIACNDLETIASLSEGLRIVLPDGSLPANERPEYVAPVVTYAYTYTYAGSYSSRDNLRVIATGFWVNSPGNPGVAGQCTWYAWYMRATDSRSLGPLPGGAVGNASAWANTFANMGYVVNHTPEVGAVFQTTGGSYYGHVGYVTAVNDDGSITVREMNLGVPYRITESEIPANLVGTYNYIH